MKKLLSVLLLLVLASTSKAQTNDTLICDVPDMDTTEFENLPWVGNNDFLEDFLDSIGYPGPQQRIIGPDQVRFRVPIKFWVYRSSAGLGGPNLQQLQNYIDNLNRFFNIDNNTWIGFYTFCDVIYIDNDAHVNVETNNEFINLLQDFRQKGCINIHIANTITDDANGFSYRARLRRAEGIFLSARTYTDPNLASTIAHEVGHYFELEHTHHFSNEGRCRQEPVDRNRTWPFFSLCFRKIVGARMCEATGDGLRDTPADPDLNENVTCTFDALGNYTNRTDNWGDFYAAPPAGSSVPDTRNLLSYNGTRSCREVFSRLQIAVMLYSLHLGKNSNNFYAWRDVQGEYDEYEWDNFSQVARPITFNEIQERNFNREYLGDGAWRQCDADWVRFVPTCNVTLLVETSAMSGRLNADTRLTLFDAALNQLAQNDNISATNLFSAISYNFVAGQEYFILVDNGGANQSTSYYRLQVHLGAISGPDVFCTDGTYSIPNLPTGGSVTWTVTPSNIVTPVVSTSNPESFTKISEGNIMLTGQVNACGVTYTISKPINVSGAPNQYSLIGYYNTEGFSGYLQDYNCLKTYTFPGMYSGTIDVSDSRATSYLWTFVSKYPSTVTTGIGPNNDPQHQTVYVKPQGGRATYRLTTLNACGSYSHDYTFTANGFCVIEVESVDPGGEMDALKMAPNPTTGSFTLSLNNEKKSTSIREIVIQNKLGIEVKRIKLNGEIRSQLINIQDLPPDMYLIQVYDGEKWRSKKIIKQ